MTIPEYDETTYMYVVSASQDLNYFVGKTGGTRETYGGNYRIYRNPYYVPITIGSVGGDPYIFPKHGPKMKLPNCDNFYRLLQIPSM
jgi:hypothetical protein